MGLMEFAVASDIHLEFWKDEPVFPNSECLILAGDVVSYKKRHLLRKLFKRITKQYKLIIYVLGNHEFYDHPFKIHSKKHCTCCNKDCIDTWDSTYNSIVSEYKLICSEFSNIRLLEREFMTIGNTRIFGATLWSEFKDSGTNDRFHVPLEHIRTLNKATKECLKDFISDKTYKYIIITHYMPSFKLVHEKFWNLGLMNTCFACDCESLFTDDIILWIYGHTHEYDRRIMNNIEFICNPRGYPGEDSEYREAIFTSKL